MTKEEAEEYAKNMAYRDAVYNALQGKCVPYRKATLIKLYELLDRLERESCADAISCEAVIEWLKAKDIITLSSQEETARKELKALPSVTPQPKTGRWTRVTDKAGRLVWECDCGWQQRFNTNYCPDCGSKMQEVEE